MKLRSLLACGLVAAVLALPVAGSASASVPPAAHAANDNWFFDGAVHPYGNPHWCFYGALSTQIAVTPDAPRIVTGTPVALEKCRQTSKHLPVGGEYWHGYRIKTVGQMFLLAKANYVLGRLDRKSPVVFVPFEHMRNTNSIIGFTRDKHGHWHIDLVDQVNKKPYALIMPEHLKATVTAYAMKWHEAGTPMPKGWTDIVILPPWEQVQIV